MAKKLSTTLSLVNNFSNQLNGVNTSLNRTSGIMGKFRQLVGSTSPTRMFDGVRGGVSSTGDMLGNMTNGFAAKMGIISGIAQSVTSSVISSVTSMSRQMMSELSESSAVWQTFEGNMSMIGKSKKEIANVKGELQDFATKTIYSASDMSSTYSQLAAVGVQNTTELVKGFGGLAAAAENPQQAMKTLSQQATQMAAKPTVQWQDFKLMLEQTPAGVAAVAKSMGKSTSQLVQDVQEGTIATQDFFDAVAETGTNKAFTKMATTFKTIGQATDGLTEGLTNKLQPAFDKASQYGINFVSGLSDRIDQMDFSKLTAWVDEFGPKAEEGLSKAVEAMMNFIPKVIGFVSSGFATAKKAAQEFWKGFTETGALDKVKSAFESIKDALGNISESMPKDSGFIERLGTLAGNGISGIATMIEDFATSISRLSPDQMKSIGESIGMVIGAFAAMKHGKSALLLTVLGGVAKVISKLSPSQLEGVARGVAILAGAFVAFKIGKGALDAIGAIKGLFGGSGDTSGEGAATKVKDLSDGLNSLAKSTGVALVIGSISLLALALKPLAELGTSAIAPLAAFGIVVSGLGFVLSKVGAELQVSALGILVFAAAVSVMALSMSLIANTGQYGAQNMAAFGLVVAGLVVVFGLFGSALNVAIPGMLAFGATMLMVGAAMLIATPAIQSLPPVIDALANAFVLAVAAITVSITEIMGSVTEFVSQLGDSISQVVETVSTGFSTMVTSVSDGISQVVETVGAAISGVLDSIAGVFESIGAAALDAGTGMERMASAIGSLVDMNLLDLTTTLGAVALAIKDLSSNSKELATVGTAMSQLASSLVMISGSVTGISLLGVYIVSVSNAMTNSIASFILFSMAMSLLSGAVSIAMGPMQLLSTVSMSTSMSLMMLGAMALLTSGQLAILNTGLLVIVATMEIVQASVATGMARVVSAFTLGMGQSVVVTRSGSAQIVSSFSGLRGQLYSAGSFAMQGLTNGIRAGAGSAIAAAKSVANQVASTVRSALDIHSPSRVFMAIGRFVSQGLANGISMAQNLVTRASNALAGAAYTPMQLASENIEGSFTENVYLDDDEVSDLRASFSRPMIVKNREIAPKIEINVDNRKGDPIDENALAEKVADKIQEVIDSDMN